MVIPSIFVLRHFLSSPLKIVAVANDSSYSIWAALKQTIWDGKQDTQNLIYVSISVGPVQLELNSLLTMINSTSSSVLTRYRLGEINPNDDETAGH